MKYVFKKYAILCCMLTLAMILAFGCKTAEGPGGLKSEDGGEKRTGLRQLSAPVASYSFTLEDENARMLSLADLKGKVVVITFWATWCHACKEEMDNLKALKAAYASKGLEVLAINIDTADEHDRAVSIGRLKKLNYPMLFDPDSRVVSQYNPSQELPYSAIIDRQGQIRYVLLGFFPGEEKQIETSVTALLNE